MFFFLITVSASEKLRQLQAQARQLQAEIDRELPTALADLPANFGYSDVNHFIRALRQASRTPAPRRPRAPVTPKRRKPSPPPAVGLAATRSPQASPPSSSLSTPPAGAPSPTDPAALPPLPTGTSLDDPTNFGQLPDFSLLKPPHPEYESFRQKLSTALQFAQRVLHTSRVPASVWREWRQFDRQATEFLRLAAETQVRANPDR